MLIKNARFAVLPDRIAENINIQISGGKIAGFEADKTGEIIDGSDFIVMPGLVNTHTHAAMTLFRGLANDLPLFEWLSKHIWPAEAKLKPKDIYAGSLLAAAEMLKSGTTAFNDMYFFEEKTAKAAKETGIRPFVSHTILSAPGMSRLIKPLKNYSGGIMLGPHSIYTCNEETLMKIKDVAEKYKSKIHIHVSETRKEVDDCLNEHKMKPAEYMEKLGLLGENTIAAHCCWLSDKEIDILRMTKTNVAHCATSNMKLASGVMPIRKMGGINIGIGTDGAASNNSLNIFAEMKAASMLHKMSTYEPTTTSAGEMLKMATENGARMLGLNYGIRKGADADLILIKTNEPSLQPLAKERLIPHLVYSFNGNVDTAIIKGKVVVKNRKLTNIDEEKICGLVEKATRRLS
jgi:5-methylthioadenosine/S-adenosylhomocysteine deaminase